MMIKPSIKRKTCVLLAIFTLIFCLAGCCDHVWVDANCTSPKTCSECGATEGDVVHSFESINCTDAMVCSICGATGETVGHKWLGSGCTERIYCEVCGATDGEVLGHTTRYGKCTRCGNSVDELVYMDGFAIVTYKDTAWMKEQADFVDVYVIGTIVEIDKMNRVLIVDGEGENWTVGVGTACDLSPYIGTECEVYGFSSGAISSQYDTPLINMDHDDNRIVFADGKTLYPESYESTQQFEDKYADNFNNGSDGMVWIPSNGGSKYHSNSSCSGMKNPEQVTEAEAIERGFNKCGKCW